MSIATRRRCVPLSGTSFASPVRTMEKDVHNRLASFRRANGPNALIAVCVWHSESTAGRPRKPTTTKRGRPPSSHSGESKRKSSELSQSGETQEAPVELAVNIDAAIAGRVQAHTCELPLLPERVVGWEKGVKKEEIVCPVCQNLLERPLVVPVPGCEHAACWSCWEQWLPQSQTARSDVSAAELQPVARSVWQSLITTTLHCNFYAKSCQETVTLAKLCQHASFIFAPPLLNQRHLKLMGSLGHLQSSLERRLWRMSSPLLWTRRSPAMSNDSWRAYCAA